MTFCLWATAASSSNYAQSSTTFSLKNGHYMSPGQVMINYCFAPVAGYSAFGSFVGNSSTDGPFVYTGFRPKWLLWKYTGWGIVDDTRTSSNPMGDYLVANASDAEGVTNSFDFLSNGFKLRDANFTNQVTVYYAAFAEHPFKTARAR